MEGGGEKIEKKCHFHVVSRTLSAMWYTEKRRKRTHTHTTGWHRTWKKRRGHLVRGKVRVTNGKKKEKRVHCTYELTQLFFILLFNTLMQSFFFSFSILYLFLDARCVEIQSMRIELKSQQIQIFTFRSWGTRFWSALLLLLLQESLWPPSATINTKKLTCLLFEMVHCKDERISFLGISKAGGGSSMFILQGHSIRRLFHFYFYAHCAVPFIYSYSVVALREEETKVWEQTVKDSTAQNWNIGVCVGALRQEESRTRRFWADNRSWWWITVYICKYTQCTQLVQL